MAVTLGVFDLIDQLRTGQPLNVFKFINRSLALLHYAAQLGVEYCRIWAFHDLAVLELLGGVENDVSKDVAELSVVRY